MSDTNGLINWDDDDEQVVDPPTSIVASPDPFATVAVHDGDSFEPTREIIAMDTFSDDEGSEHLMVTQLDADGNQVTTQINLSLPPLNEAEARQITEQIRRTTGTLYVLLLRSHRGKAWQALGYNSFESYVKEEFNYSRSYAYKLLDAGKTVEAIEAVAPEGTHIEISELTARNLKKSLPELLDTVEDRTQGHTPTEAAQIIEDVIRETRDRKEEENTFNEDFDDFGDNEFGGNGSPSSGSAAFEFIDEDEDESINEFLGGDNDPSEIVRRLDSLYTLLTNLQNANELSNKNLDELFPYVPGDRHEEVTRLTAVNLDFAGKLKDAWAAYVSSNMNEDLDDDDDLEDAE